MNERGRDLDESSPVWFSFAGAKVIVVKGGATGRIYRFVPGSRLRVHTSDAPSMRAIPGLRRQGTLEELAHDGLAGRGQVHPVAPVV